MLMKHRLWLATLSIGILMLGSFAQAQDSSTTVTTAFSESQPNTLDPHAARTTDDFLVIRNVCDGLTDYDPATLETIPGLAESWTVSDDGLVYTFTLRDGVTFFDGSTLDSADVKYSFDRLARVETGTSYTAPLVLRNIVGWGDVRPPAPPAPGEGTPTPVPPTPATTLSGVEAVDPLTVRVTLSSPVTSFLTRLTLPGGFIIAEGSAEGVDFATTGPMCTGAYQVQEFVAGDRVVLTANDNFWGGAPEVKTVVVRVVPEISTQVIEFEAGNLDISIAPPADLPRIREDETLNSQLVGVATLSNYNFRINLNDEAMGNVLVRRALSLAINRQQIVDVILQGLGTPADGLYPPGLPLFDTTFEPFPYDPIAARALLAEAGYPDGIELTIRTDQNETENRVLNAIAAQVADAGITLIVNSTEASVYTEDRTACNMQMGGIRWGMDYADPENMVVLLLPNAPTRVNCGYGDVEVAPEIQVLYDQGISMPFGPERDEIFREIERIAMENVLILPVYHGVSLTLVSSRLGGIPVDNQGVRRFRFITLNN
jgi:peptide/nickel transport system substrate-binding protein